MARIKYTKQDFLEPLNEALEPTGETGGLDNLKLMEELRKKAQVERPLPAKEIK